MSFYKTAIAAALLSITALASGGAAKAADLPTKAPKPVADLPFFLVIDDRVTFSYIFDATDPGVWSRRKDGSIDGKTTKQVYSFTHFDIWQYGTNFFTISMFKSGHNDPANPCFTSGSGTIISAVSGLPATCSGMTEIYGLFRSTLGWNQLSNSKMFSYGPLSNISFYGGLDGSSENSFFAAAKRDVVGGLQFEFSLPYKGYFNVSPVVYWEYSSHSVFAQCNTFGPGIAGVTCLSDGDRRFKPTWAVETNYYMDLGFLPESIQYFSISGRAAWYGKKGTENNPVPYIFPGNINTAVEFNSEPIRLTFDASKAAWGAKYSHFVDVWVAYRYWQNKFGLDHTTSVACTVSPGVSNNSCTEQSLYAGMTVKF